MGKIFGGIGGDSEIDSLDLRKDLGKLFFCSLTGHFSRN